MSAAMTGPPVLIACSHGTRSADGRATIAALVAEAARELPGVRVEHAVVDVELPEVADVVARVAADGPAVVVPLLLSEGHHTRVDIGAACAPYTQVTASSALGPHPLLVQLLRERLGELPGGDAGFRPGDHVVLAAAGSTDAASARAVERMRDLLQAELPAPITLGYGAGARPRLPEAVAAARAAGARRVVAASYVLAPGHFAGLVRRSGADLVSAPLGVHRAAASVIAARYREAARAITGQDRRHGRILEAPTKETTS